MSDLISKRLRGLLEKDAALFAAVQPICGRLADLLTANRLPFFPSYTPHGADHVRQVLATAERLIPAQAWPDDGGPLTPGDAALLILGTFLHDFGMHTQHAGFEALRSGTYPGSPEADKLRQRFGDKPWQLAWDDFLQQAKRLDDRGKTDLFGPIPSDPTAAAAWEVRDPPAHEANWTHFDHFLVGEFLRRHHPRLAHEIALFGFPGIARDKFPSVAESLAPFIARYGKFNGLADLAGLVARSHGMDLRRAADILKEQHKRVVRPADTSPVYHMALLRIADYLDITSSRTPTILLDMVRPQSRLSVEEWDKHEGIATLNWDHEDPKGIMADVPVTNGDDGPRPTLRTLLQLRELFTSVQSEMDKSTAVLREVFGGKDGQDRLSLAKARLDHRLDDPDFRKDLPYLPRRLTFATANADILKLLIKPLYGDDPTIGIRELVQNAVDAVREMRSVLERRPEIAKAPGFARPDLGKDGDTPVDVLVDVTKDETGRWLLTITDRGVGMNADIIENYFLKAGASYRYSPAWAREFKNEDTSNRVIRTGRFGIGALAAFLLDDEIEVTTRRFDEERGLTFKARIESEPIEVFRVDAPVGTQLRLRLADAAADRLHAEYAEAESKDRTIFQTSVDALTHFVVRDPLVHAAWNGRPLSRDKTAPSEVLSRNSSRAYVESNGLAVDWSYGDHVPITVNGFAVGERWQDHDSYPKSDFDLRLNYPSIAIIDRDLHVPMNLARSQVLSTHQKLLPGLYSEVVLDIAAMALAIAQCFEPLLKSADRIVLPNAPHAPSDRDPEIELSFWIVTPRGVTARDPLLIASVAQDALLSLNTSIITLPIHIATIVDRPNYETQLLSADHYLRTACGIEGILRGSSEQRAILRAVGPKAGRENIPRTYGKSAGTYVLDVRDRPTTKDDLAFLARMKTQFAVSGSLAVERDLANAKPQPTEFTKLWLAALGQPLVPFAAAEREALIDSRPEPIRAKLRDWSARWLEILNMKPEHRPFESLRLWSPQGPLLKHEEHDESGYTPAEQEASFGRRRGAKRPPRGGKSDP